MLAGVIHNPRSHAHRHGASRARDHRAALEAAPETPEELVAELERFRAEGVDLVIIDGGDGTVREVLSALPAAYEDPPLLAVLPSGKTNILAFDLGAPRGWTVEAALIAAQGGRTTMRSPLEVRHGDVAMRGFVFGAAGFVRAISRSQKLHRAGVFQEAVVGLGLIGAVGSLLMRGSGSGFGKGEPLELRIDEGELRGGPRLATIVTTLERLPYGMRPFGPPRPGLKVLDVDAPPSLLPIALRRLLKGEDDGWLAAHGYRRGSAQRVDISLSGSFVLDGEAYPAGEVVLTEGRPLRFVVP